MKNIKYFEKLVKDASYKEVIDVPKYRDISIILNNNVPKPVTNNRCPSCNLYVKSDSYHYCGYCGQCFKVTNKQARELNRMRDLTNDELDRKIEYRNKIIIEGIELGDITLTPESNEQVNKFMREMEESNDVEEN